MGRPSKPPDQRINHHPLKHPWKPAPDAPWAGEIPDPPEHLLPASNAAWFGWFRSWFSGHWTEADIPQLRQIIGLFDKVERGNEGRGDRTELRNLFKAFGLSPEGRKSLCWEEPKPDKKAEPSKPTTGRRLKVVDKTG